MRFMMQDSIMVAGQICTGGSKMLHNFKAPFSATVYEKCRKNGMEFSGLTLPSEFSIDSLFDESDPRDDAITAILENRCDAVLCNDVFGKLRRQAPQNGLIYIHPAYGTVSRFGLMPTVSSMDQIGVLCRTLNEGLELLSIISGHDENDGTSLPAVSYRFHADEKKETPTIGKASPSLPLISSATGIELKYSELFAPVFYILATAELSNNTTRYDGVKFGYRAEGVDEIDDLYLKSRSDSFGRDLQLASLVGCMVLSHEHYDNLYHKAMQIRRLVHDHYSEILASIDAVALPTKSDVDTKFEQAALYALPTLGGFACISLPYRDGTVQFICRHGQENTMFALAQEGAQ